LAVNRIKESALRGAWFRERANRNNLAVSNELGYTSQRSWLKLIKTGDERSIFDIVFAFSCDARDRRLKYGFLPVITTLQDRVLNKKAHTLIDFICKNNAFAVLCEGVRCLGEENLIPKQSRISLVKSLLDGAKKIEKDLDALSCGEVKHNELVDSYLGYTYKQIVLILEAFGEFQNESLVESLRYQLAGRFKYVEDLLATSSPKKKSADDYREFLADAYGTNEWIESARRDKVIKDAQEKQQELALQSVRNIFF